MANFSSAAELFCTRLVSIAPISLRCESWAFSLSWMWANSLSNVSTLGSEVFAALAGIDANRLANCLSRMLTLSSDSLGAEAGRASHSSGLSPAGEPRAASTAPLIVDSSWAEASAERVRPAALSVKKESRSGTMGGCTNGSLATIWSCPSRVPSADSVEALTSRWRSISRDTEVSP